MVMKNIASTIAGYNTTQNKKARDVCVALEKIITTHLKNSESKIWHGSPVWFIAGNPIVAYSVRKDSRVSLMFFSGQGFDEEDLLPAGKFKAAEFFYASVTEIQIAPLKRWLKKAQTLQWDYKNIVKNKGVLVKLRQ